MLRTVSTRPVVICMYIQGVMYMDLDAGAMYSFNCMSESKLLRAMRQPLTKLNKGAFLELNIERKPKKNPRRDKSPVG
ncbi:hypothetical protein QPL79_05650 [Ignisphaera sp. 4213-co]|uniref:Uncharacterized protein n=1 Tax=Ignisphaera cupida TaxID=3050454 RepID=A0ABD4Z7E2_9CREN|nr:hypothetical protein [Ignisphaera sp. 4213-co]MDK6028843.1 hypothetical protein [Ignisphaera sp. 4213-co]